MPPELFVFREADKILLKNKITFFEIFSSLFGREQCYPLKILIFMKYRIFLIQAVGDTGVYLWWGDLLDESISVKF